jgi:transposase InsO family protein
MPCNASYARLFFLKVFHKYYNFICIFICTPICTKNFILAKSECYKNKFDTKIKKIRSDNDTEFKNTQVEDFLDEEGIKHEFSAPYTPQQNGVAKRKNRTLIEMVRTMFDEYKTSDRFWAEAINTTCHATNLLYLHKLLKKTSYELLTGNKHNVS